MDDQIPGRLSRTAVRVLAIAGTVVGILPLAVPVALSLVRLVAAGELRLDLLMPGELFVLVPAGGVLLLVAAFLARRRRVLAVVVATLPVLLFALLALLTALRDGSGGGPAEGWGLAVVYGLYVAAVVALVVAGVVLSADLSRRPPRVA